MDSVSATPVDPQQELIERLARKLYEDGARQPVGSWPPPPRDGIDYAEAFREQACACLAAPGISTSIEKLAELVARRSWEREAPARLLPDWDGLARLSPEDRDMHVDSARGFVVEEMVPIIIASSEGATDQRYEELAEDMAENCVSKVEATKRLNQAVEIARAAERSGLEARLRGDEVRRALLSMLSVGSQELDTVIDTLVDALDLGGEMPEALRDLKFGPRAYTADRAEEINRAVAERATRVDAKAAELCKAIDGDDWEDATDLQKSAYRSRAAALVEAIPFTVEPEESEGERHDREVAEAEELVDWRCECGDLNRGHEWCCYRCGAGKPETREDAEAFVVIAHQKLPERLRAALGGE